MKNLKFDHELAQLIRAGKKTATWRIYDDKDISVNDEIELIDKVDAGNPATWTRIGIARVDTIIEKRLGEIEPADFDGHEHFDSSAQMLQIYQRYYGPQVSMETPIKIIHFSIVRSERGNMEKIAVQKTTEMTELKVYADGGSRGNPGPSASGYAILSMDNQIITKRGFYLGVTTNNQAEYQALKLALEAARHMGAHKVHVFMDSALVINQMLGIFKVRNRDLWPIHDSIRKLAERFENITFTHVPRELNKLADGAVNEALDAAAAAQSSAS